MGTTTRGGSTPDSKTFEGAAGWKRDTFTDLFLRSTSSLHGGEKTFYEDGDQRDAMLSQLTRGAALADSVWMFEFTSWLRTHGNIRTAPLMIAADAVHAILANGGSAVDTSDWTPQCAPAPGRRGLLRSLIDHVCQRPDEPGELLAYWMATYGRKIPKPVKRGIADASRRLYSERSLLKYDTGSHPVRFADVLELCHASPHPDKVAWQGDLFKHAIDRRHGRDEEVSPRLAMVRANRALRAAPNLDWWLDANVLQEAGMTWEDALSAVGSKIEKKKIWEAVIPSMGYMALIRNLRNFDEAGVSDTVANSVIVKLVQEKEVARSRQLPFRFHSAYKNAPSDRWSHALSMALDLCLPNVPELPGRTLVLVDTSGSMELTIGGESTMTNIAAAALFGSALALRNADRVDLYQFADFPARIPVQKGGSVLKHVQAIENCIGDVGHGTDIVGSMMAAYAAHDRVIILSDMQTSGHWSRARVSSTVPVHIPVYAFNIGASSTSPMETGQDARFDLGGLTDHTFAQIPRLEAGKTGTWPWETAV